MGLAPMPVSSSPATLANTTQAAAGLLLLVDDEANILSALKRSLRRDGYTILTAESGVEGLRLLAEHAVDVIVSDQRMPGMTGVEFLRLAKENWPDTMRIVLSGYTELESVTAAINEGAVYKFLTKPWEDEHLRRHIADAYQHKVLLDENRQLDHQLREMNARLAGLLEASDARLELEETTLTRCHRLIDFIPVPLVCIDADGLIVLVNRAGARQFGTAPGIRATEALPATVRDARNGDIVELAGAGFAVLVELLPGAGRIFCLLPRSPS